jgi:hypothetical protein
MPGFLANPLVDRGTLALLILCALGVVLLLRWLFFALICLLSRKSTRRIRRLTLRGEFTSKVREIPLEGNGSNAVKLTFRRTPRPSEVAARVPLMGESKAGMRRWRAN